MQIGLVGLGRMGGNIARRLLQHGHEVIVHDRDPRAMAALAGEGAQRADTVEAIARSIGKPRVVWLMLPAGEATEKALGDVASQLSPDDVIVDGGNTFWKDDIRRADMLSRHGIRYVDVGTSGGVWGLERGYCLMAGGEREVVERLRPIFEALAPPGGFVHAGTTGAGHFVKMVHNGIEYGLMQAYAEGFDILRNAAAPTVAERERLDLDVAAIAETWRHGSVVSSWLLDLAAAALAKDPELSKFSGVVADSGEGRWALMAAIEERVPAEVLAAALHARFRSQQDHTYAEKGAVGVARGVRRASGNWIPVFTGMTHIVVMGVSGCGKSTIAAMLADRLGLEYVDADWLHPQANVEKMQRGLPLDDVDRWPWLAAIAARMAELRAQGRGCVVACSALKRAYRDVLRDGREDVRFVHLDGPAEAIAPRITGRDGHFMPASLLASQFAALEPPQADERALAVSVTLTPAEIVEAVVTSL